VQKITYYFSCGCETNLKPKKMNVYLNGIATTRACCPTHKKKGLFIRKTIVCPDCGKTIEMTGSKQRRCVECARIHTLNRNRINKLKYNAPGYVPKKMVDTGKPLPPRKYDCESYVSCLSVGGRLEDDWGACLECEDYTQEKIETADAFLSASQTNYIEIGR